MKYLAAAILLIVWMAITLCLALTLIGIVIMVDENSDWMKIPKKLLYVFNQ